jgi:hypothetical protein
VGDFWIQEVMRSKEMFRWDGFRSDGTPGPYSGRDYTGQLHLVQDPDAANAKFLEKIRRELPKRYPDFKFGWNYQVFDPEGVNIGPKQAERMIPGSYMLWESFNSAGQPGSVLHDWKRMAHDLQRETGYIRERGGFSHVGWMGSNRYLEAVASACGAHTDTWGDKEHYPNYRRFEFRWAEFLWDTALRYVRPATAAVKVEAPARVWWRDFVHTRDLPLVVRHERAVRHNATRVADYKQGQRVIVHLLNMPANDDEGWADRPPDPATHVRVAFKVPAGKKLTRIVALSPDTEGDVLNVTPAADGSVTLPQVTLWTMVVAEFGG